MNNIIDAIRLPIRRFVAWIARQLQNSVGNKLHPNVVTIIGAAMHVPIAWLIATEQFIWAAVLLVIFGLFDVLDGELARLQKRASQQGMLLDASTDRMKEVLLYTGVAYALATGDFPSEAAWAVAACGASLCVSYIKAKGEAAVASGSRRIDHHTLNHMFKDGLARFEVRMVILLIGLLSNQLFFAIAAIAVLSSFTALQRLIVISKKL